VMNHCRFTRYPNISRETLGGVAEQATRNEEGHLWKQLLLHKWRYDPQPSRDH
jgi:hypothetical protein